MQRRSFLKAGLLGGLALVAGGAVYRQLRPAVAQRFALDAQGRWSAQPADATSR